MVRETGWIRRQDARHLVIAGGLFVGVVGTLVLALSVGGLFGVLRKARAEDRPEAEASDEDYQLPAKAVTS